MGNVYNECQVTCINHCLWNLALRKLEMVERFFKGFLQFMKTKFYKEKNFCIKYCCWKYRPWSIPEFNYNKSLIRYNFDIAGEEKTEFHIEL